ncbi:MAG: hypothetical protein ACI4DN_03175 [Lachnospiraceae bacterium]
MNNITGKNSPFTISKIISPVTLGALMVFYLFFALYDGAVIAVDSPGYIEMSFSREPLYPLFLAFFRLFGENYLLYAVIVQSLLMAYAAWALADYLRLRLKIHPLYGLLLYLFVPATSLLCRFAAKRSSMYTNSILSEGIATSLYLLFILYLFRFLLEKNKSWLAAASFLAFLLISTRKQMLMVMPMLILVIVFFAASSSLWKRILQAAILSLVILTSSTLLDCTYNYAVRGQFSRHSSDNRFVTTMLFYNAQRSDADYIADESIRELFLDIYAVCEENGYLGSQAEKGWLNEVTHFGDHYDHIQIDTMWPMILEQAGENVGEESVALKDMETDRINSVIIRSILPHQLPKLAHSLLNNFASGMITTVAQRTPALIVYSVFVYAAFCFLFVRVFLLYHKTKKQEYLHVLLFSGITLLGILCNVGLVSAVIFCQTRYTIYNMPLFYMSGALLLYVYSRTILVESMESTSNRA